jgi:hypothetical protein
VGWAGANDIYTGVWDAIDGENIPDSSKTAILESLIRGLQFHDWDTESEVTSRDDPAWTVKTWEKIEPGFYNFEE